MKTVKLLAIRNFSGKNGMITAGTRFDEREDVAKEYVDRRLCKYLSNEWNPTERVYKAAEPSATITEDVELKPLNKPKRNARRTKKSTD